ncbi:MAG: ATP-dependent helicase [Velocimicrobium sp.]
MNEILKGLNPEQAKAVMHNTGPLLILAGAGSGKTRVLTHRIAYLIDECQINPWNILALTFTNKAASEMRERVDRIVGYGSENIWVSTFHSTCVRILRRYIDVIGYDKSFTIYDSDDQKTLIREVLKYLNIDTKTTKERAVLSVISNAKDELITPYAFSQNAIGDYNQERYAKIYMEYQKRLKQNNALDFDDLIVKTVELFENHPDVLVYYQNRFQYIMVDEYQDTNTAQFHLIRLLASTKNADGVMEHNLCVVGDDDQSIYKFRGANIHNILNFEKQYPSTHVIKLEQNYRSTKTILNAANEVIHNNLERTDKSLWTDNEEGAPIAFTQFNNEYEESDAIVTDIYNAVFEDGYNYNDFAILYRTNAQSRIFEEKLVRKNIPYKIVGAVNFYARREVKDLLAYLKTVDNGLDDVAVKRIINVPRRGIGLTTIDRVTDYAIKQNLSFYQALQHASMIPGIGRGINKIESFVSFIEVLKGKIKQLDYTIEDLMNEIIEATGYVEALKGEESIEAQTRIENIEELLNKIIAFERAADEAPTLSQFLEEVALVADIDTLEDSTNLVVLMTLHSAKGLEFPFVYLCGMEDGIFPSYMTINSDDISELEEERRLCYVGITRAKKRLSISCARQRMVHGETQFNKPSRFVREIPRYLLKETRESVKPRYPKINTTAFSSNPSNLFSNNPMIQKGFSNSREQLNDTIFDKPKKVTQTPDKSSFPPAYTIGDRIEHTRFGTGIVTDMKALPNDYEVSVVFDTQGVKKMRASFAKLSKINQ